MEPMQVAAQFEKRSQQRKRLKELLGIVNAKCEILEQKMLELIEAELLPPSFTGRLGASIYTREEIWASPAEGDHAALTRVLAGFGDRYSYLLPSNVNSQSLSSLVRKSYNEDTGEYELPPELLASLKITKRQRVVANG